MKILQTPQAEKIKMLKQLRIYQFLSESDFEAMANIAEHYSFGDHEIIVEEGSITPYLYAVVKGSVSVMVNRETGKDTYIGTIGEHEIFGEAGLFVNVKRTADVVAMGDVEVIRLDRRNFAVFLKTNPKGAITILMLIIYSLLRKLRESNQELAFERKTDFDQVDVDSLIDNLLQHKE